MVLGNDQRAVESYGEKHSTNPKKQIMNEELKAFQKYFDLREVVSKKTFDRYQQQAWQFFDPRLLAVVVWLRDGMKIPLVCNNWAKGGKFDERGFRSNLDPLCLEKTKAGKLYCTAHGRGQGIDLSSGKASANEIRQWIRKNINSCPYAIRLENDKSAPTWCHIDVCNTTDKKLVEFSV